MARDWPINARARGGSVGEARSAWQSLKQLVAVRRDVVGLV